MRARPAWEASAAGSKAARRAKPSTTSCLPSRSSTSASDRPYSGSHVVSEEPFETFRVCKMGQTSYIVALASRSSTPASDRAYSKSYMVRKTVSSVRWYEAVTEPLSAPFHHMDADLAALETRKYVFPEEVQEDTGSLRAKLAGNLKQRPALQTITFAACSVCF